MVLDPLSGVNDERLSRPGCAWLTYSGQFTHISGHPSAAGRAQDRESSPVRDRHFTTVPRNQPNFGRPGTNLERLATWRYDYEHHLAMIGGAVCLSVLLSVTSWYHVKTNSSWYRAVFASRYKGCKGSGFIKRLYCSTSHSRRSGTDHTVLPANYTIPAFTS